MHPRGATHLDDDKRIDVTERLPATTKTMDVIPDAVWTWMYHGHADHHIEAGTTARFTVRPVSAVAPVGS